MKELASRVKAKGSEDCRGDHHLIADRERQRRHARREHAPAGRQPFIRSGGLFDAVADFDAVTVDPATGALRSDFVPNSTVGGAGDRLHPNRAGYQAMGSAVDLKILAPR
jgi:lysophospholipase L1-like esterase